MRFLISMLSFIMCSSSLTGQDLLEDLVAFYSFCNCDAQDQSGNERHGTLMGAPVCIDGIKGQGFRFNAGMGNNECGLPGGDYIRLPSFGAIWERGITVGAWVQYENVANYERIIDLGNGDGDNGGMNVWFGREGNSNNLTLESWISDDANVNRSTGRLVANNAITNGQIEFYCFTISGNDMKIYVNGNLVAEKQGHPISNISRSENFIGRSNWCYADPDFKGFMDEVRLYNRALTPEEIKILYQNPFQVEGKTKFDICPGESVQLSLQGGIAYQWQPDPTLSSTDISNPIATPKTNTVYESTIFFADGCSFTEQIEVIVHDFEDVHLDFDICEGESYLGYSQTGTYLDTLESEYGCQYLRILNLQVQEITRILDTIFICPGESHQGRTDPGLYHDTIQVEGCDTIRSTWLEIQGPTIQNIQIEPATCDAANGRIELEVDDPAEVQVTINNQLGGLVGSYPKGQYLFSLSDRTECMLDTLIVLPGLACPIYVPNAFSPNQDGLNDRLALYSSEGEFVKIVSYRIFNRWGSLIYQAEHFMLQEGDSFWWDGQIGLDKANAGIYIYIIEIDQDSSKPLFLRGDVMLLR